MEFTDAASYFDQDEVFDAYTDEFLFLAHTKAHDDHTSSGATARRRTMTTEVQHLAPSRRVIRWYDTYWLMGNSNTDGFLGSEARRSHGLKKSTGVVQLATPGQACLGQSGTEFHAHKEFYRDMTDAATSSDIDVLWNVFCPSSEAVVKGSFIVHGTDLLRVRNTYLTIDEYLVAEADQFDADARQSAVFTGPAALEFTAATTPATITANVVQTNSAKFYEFRLEAEADKKPGDLTVFVAKSSLTPVVGGHLRLLGTNWRITMMVPEADSWALRVRVA